MADDEQATPRRKRRARTEDSGREQGDETVRDEAAAGGDEQGGDERDGDEPEPVAALPAAGAARRAARYVAEFIGRHPESVVSVERRDGDWLVGVEVVETHRIPDTTDVLAIYEVCLDGGGRLLSYRRTRRYARGQLDKECR